MKKSTLLALAIEEFLSDGHTDSEHKSDYLCIAVSATGYKYNQCETAMEIQARIRDLIKPDSFVLSWLSHNSEYNPYDYPRSVRQEYRKRWAEHLIEQFIAEGN